MFDLVVVFPFPRRGGVGGFDRAAIVGMHGFQEGLVGGAKLLRFEPEDPVHLVRPGEPVGGQVELPASEVGDLLGSLEPPLALAQRRLRLLALGDVLDRSDHAHQHAAVIEDEHGMFLHRALGAVGAHQAMFEAVGPPGRYCFGDGPGDAGLVVGMHPGQEELVGDLDRPGS